MLYEKYFDAVQKLKMMSINVTNFAGIAPHIFEFSLIALRECGYWRNACFT